MLRYCHFRQPTLIYLHAKWANECKQITEVFQTLAKEDDNNNIRFAMVTCLFGCISISHHLFIDHFISLRLMRRMCSSFVKNTKSLQSLRFYTLK